VSLTRPILAGVFVSTFVAHALYVGASRKDRHGGSRCRRDDVFGSAHGLRLFSDRLLWVTDASRLPKPIRRQSLGFWQTVNGRDDSDLRQLWLLVPFPPSRAGKHLQMYAGPKAQISGIEIVTSTVKVKTKSRFQRLL
jgi:hypothetical protein